MDPKNPLWKNAKLNVQFVKQGVAEKFDPRKMKSSNDTDVRTVGAGAVRVPSDASREIWNEPTWSFKEIADKLGVSTNTLNLLAWKQIGGFPDARPGLTSKHGSSKYYKQSEVKRWVNANKVRELIKGRVATNQGVAEGESNAMSDTAKRLANKDDGKVAKLRAAGDKRREDELKGRNIAKKNKSSKDQWGNFKEEVVRRETFEETRMSAAAKLGKAWDAQKAKSDASRQRAKDLLNPPKPEPKKDDVKETIKKVGSQYELVSKTGKNLGKYPTKAGAEKREQQVNYFKHANEDAAGVGIITKQNTTVDVNKNTPRKNLKAFRLIK
jgi:hypothetical protein